MPSRRATMLSIAAAAAAFALPLPAAQALQIHGVQVDESTRVGGHVLVLNGAGTRYFLVFKVYVAALYLPHKTTRADAALGMAGPKELRLVMLRDVTAKELGDKLTDGIRNNLSPEEFGPLIPGLARLGELFSRKRELKAGDAVVLRAVPGVGMTIDIDGVAADKPYTEPDFFKSMLKVWLGEHPADSRLKDALLGGAGRD